MKKIFNLFAIAFISLQTFAQITLNSADMPLPGWTHRTVRDDTVGAINFGIKGPNRVYDFSNLAGTVFDTIYYNALTPAQQSRFPNADVVVTADSVNFLYTNTTNTKFDWEGVETPVGGILTAFNFSPVTDIYRFPTQYNGTFTGTSGFQKSFPGSQVGQPTINQVRITYTTTYYDTIDGWGKTVTPIGAYKSLRQKRKEFTRTLVEYKLFSFSPYAQLSDTRDTTIRYTYPAIETKGGSVVIFNYDSSDNVTAVTYTLIPPFAPVASFAYAYGNGGDVLFTDSTDGYPDTYLWDFGDGNTSSSQNPNHTYTANGAYYVCLTVTNAGGSTNYCDSVYVTGVNSQPVAVNDSLSITQATSTIFHVAANDTDPDADNLCLDTVWGSAYVTEYIGGSCDMAFIAPDSCFTGVFTFFYRVCDDGFPSLCDTAAVTVTVVPDAGFTPTITIAGDNNICSGTATTFTANITAGGSAPVYQWKVNGVDAGTGAATYSTSNLTDGDSVRCVLTSNANCANPPVVTSNAIVMVVSSSIVPSVTVAANTGTTICEGTSVTFTATPSGGGTAPSYQWLLNGNSTGTTAASFTTALLAHNDTVSCLLTSSAGCASPQTAVSNNVIMTVNLNVTPTISITVNGSDTVCSGTVVTFTATVTYEGANPFYQWKVNGVNAGSNSGTFISDPITNIEPIECSLTSDAVCATPAEVTSNAITIYVNPLVVPSISISASDTSVCLGNAVTFTSSVAGEGTNPVYQWLVNGNAEGTNSSTFTGNSFAHNDAVTCLLTSNADCATPAQVTSSPVTLSVTNLTSPTVSVNVTDSVICEGDEIVFTATITDGGNNPVFQWKVNTVNAGTNSSAFTSSSFSNADAVSVEVTSSLVCSSPQGVVSSAITVTVHPLPATPVVTQSGDTLSSSSVAGNQWFRNGNAVNGATSQVYSAEQNGNYYTVVTDANGCVSDTSNRINVLNVGINAIGESSVTVYPNPADDKFYIETNGEEILQINIYHISGQLVKQITAPQTNTVHVAELHEGVYLAEIQLRNLIIKKRWVKM